MLSNILKRLEKPIKPKEPAANEEKKDDIPLESTEMEVSYLLEADISIFNVSLFECLNQITAYNHFMSASE